jgi:hypothetical protein
MGSELFHKDENLISQIYFIPGEKVMLDYDLAILYGIFSKRLKEAVRRNIERFFRKLYVCINLE